MALGKRLINTGAAAAAACSTDSVQAFGADSAFSSNIALYQLDSDGGTTNNVPDTTTNYNGTASNVTYATGHIGNAAVFNGSSSAIVLPNNILSSNDHSISLWFNLDDTNGIQTVIEMDYENRILFRAVSTDSNLAYIGSVGWFNHGISFSAGQWYHLVITFSAGNPFKIYVDGVLSYTGANSNINAGSNDNILGAGNSSGGIGVDGKIDQVRIFDKAISAEDVATLYDETTSTASNTNPLSEGAGVALYTMDYDASEASGYYDGTATDVEFGVGGKINYGARFNGSSSYIDTGQINFGANNISVSLWVHPNASQNAYANIIDYNHSSSGGWCIQQDNTSTNSYKVTVYNGSSYNISSAFSLTSNQWNHIVFTVTSAGAYSIYVDNGTPITGTGLTGLSTSTNNNLNIGRWHSGSSRYWGGDIDQVRIFSKALNQTEVETLFVEAPCVYTCTTDTVNYPTGTTPVAYYKLDNSSEDETGSYDGTESNIEYRFGRFGQAAVFNGSSSYISIGSLGNLLYRQEFSVSVWFKTNSLPATQGTIFMLQDINNANTPFFSLNISSTGTLRYVARTNTSSLLNGATSVLSLDTWYNAVLQITSTGAEFYLNGGEYTDSALFTPSFVTNFSGNVYLGVRGLDWASVKQYYYNGSIDQVRIFSSALTSDQVTELYEEKPCADTSNFKTVLYEGTSADQYISNVGFEPDLVWLKNRDQADHPRLYDTVRGATNVIFPSLTSQNFNAPGDGISTMDANGFFIDNGINFDGYNKSGESYVAWCWKGGGDAVTGTGTGVTNVSVSANTEAGFSIVKYTGSGAAGMNFGHGLTEAIPELVIIKNLDSSVKWHIFDGSIFERMQFDSGADDGNLGLTITSTTIQTTQTSGFEANSGWNASNIDYIAYIWHSVAGYSKIGSYTGASSSTVPVTTNFRPSIVIIKNTDTANTRWLMYYRTGDSDSYYNYLFAENDFVEQGSTSSVIKLAISDTGFTVPVASSTWVNNTGDNYLYMAFK